MQVPAKINASAIKVALFTASIVQVVKVNHLSQKFKQWVPATF